jgi:hypothetical protein
MNTKQIILIFIMFFLAMLVLTIPLWAEWALPLLKNSLQGAVKIVNDLIELLDRTRRMMGI